MDAVAAAFVGCVVDVDALRSAVYGGGLRCAPALRAKAWQVLLGYLPADQRLWGSVVRARERAYAAAADAACPSVPPRCSSTSVVDGVRPSRPPRSRTPALRSPRSARGRAIECDVPRTGALRALADPARHQGALRRVLCALDAGGVAYGQGMNELAGVLYYVFYEQANAPDGASAEAATHFCLRELVRRGLGADPGDAGVAASMGRVLGLVAGADAELAGHLRATGVDPVLYLYRWVALLFAQELPVADVVHVWDRVLADPAPPAYADAFAAVLLLSVKDDVLGLDLCGTVQRLQHVPARRVADLDVFARYLLRYPRAAPGGVPVASLMRSLAVHN